jgi:cell division protein FtsW
MAMSAAKPTTKNSTMQSASFAISPPFMLGLAVLLLMLIGLATVADASYVMEKSSHIDRVKNAPYFFVYKQLSTMKIGFCAMLGVFLLGHSRLRYFAGPITIITVIALCLVKVHGASEAAQHARRWINIGGFRAQPSELAKFALALTVASIFSRSDCRLRKNMVGLIAVLIPTLTYAGFVMKEPDLGTTCIILSIFVAIFLAARPTAAQIISLAVIGAIGLLIGGGLKQGQKQRIETWHEQGTNASGDGYQTYHGRLGLGSGQFVGRGIGQGKEKHYLPEANSDFVFATIGEETGFLGSTAVISLYAVISWAGFKIAQQARDKYSKYLALGITTWITVQAFINIAVVTMTIPATGVPLPFISYGGSAMLMLMTAVGVLMSIAIRTQPPHLPSRVTEGEMS